MVNCAKMGVNWRDLSLWEYQAMLSEWNDRQSDDEGGKEPMDSEKVDRLKRAMKAHSVH